MLRPSIVLRTLAAAVLASSFAALPQAYAQHKEVKIGVIYDYTGPLAGLITKSIPDLAPSFTRFADGLKRRVESST